MAIVPATVKDVPTIVRRLTRSRSRNITSVASTTHMGLVAMRGETVATGARPKAVIKRRNPKFSSREAIIRLFKPLRFQTGRWNLLKRERSDAYQSREEKWIVGNA